MMHDILAATLNVFLRGFIWHDAEIDERGGPIVVWLLGEQYDSGSPSPADRDQRCPRASTGRRNKDVKWRSRIVFDI